MTVLRINKCEVNFPSFLTQITYEGKPTGKYGCRLILDNKIHSKEIQIISDIITNVKKELLGYNSVDSYAGQKIINNFKTTFTDGDKDGSDFNFGKHYFTVKNDFRAPLFNVNGDKIEGVEGYEIIKPYSVVNVQIEVKFIAKGSGSVFFMLDGVQFVYQGVAPKVVRVPKEITFEDVSKTLLQSQASIGVTEEQLTNDTSGEFNQALEQTLSS